MQEKTLEEEFRERFYENGVRMSEDEDHFEFESPSPSQLLSFISSREEKAREEGRKEERQFILNVLDGIDIADKEMGVVGGTQAIRFALQNRII